MPQNTIGVDVSKDWIDACFGSTGKAERIAMTKQALARFAAAAKGSLVVLEASGGYERPLTDALTRFKADYCVVNPRHAREFARSTGTLAKTDKVDAAVLARMGRALELQPTLPAPPERVELGDLVARRDDLVAMIGAERNRLSQSRDPWIRAGITSHIKVMARQRQAIEARIAALIAAHPALAEQNRILRTLPGIGPTIAAVLLARLPELAQLDRRRLASLAGLAPHAADSGLHRGKRKIWGGRASVTRALYLAGFLASRFDANIRAYRQKLQAAGKPTKVAIIACARKLLTILAAMLRDGKDYAKSPA
jgi:transposase